MKTSLSKSYKTNVAVLIFRPKLLVAKSLYFVSCKQSKAIDCEKAWKWGKDAGNVGVDHFQYRNESANSSDIFVCTWDTVMQIMLPTISDGRYVPT